MRLYLSQCEKTCFCFIHRPNCTVSQISEGLCVKCNIMNIDGLSTTQCVKYGRIIDHSMCEICSQLSSIHLGAMDLSEEQSQHPPFPEQSMFDYEHERYIPPAIVLPSSRSMCGPELVPRISPVAAVYSTNIFSRHGATSPKPSLAPRLSEAFGGHYRSLPTVLEQGPPRLPHGPILLAGRSLLVEASDEPWIEISLHRPTYDDQIPFNDPRSNFGVFSDLPPLHIRPFIPDKPTYAPRIPDTQWEKVRPFLLQMHQKGKTRAEMLRVLSSDHQFAPSRAQLNARMVSWGYKAQKSEFEFLDTSNDPKQQSSTYLLENQPSCGPSKHSEDLVETHIVRSISPLAPELPYIARKMKQHVLDSLCYSCELSARGRWMVLYDVAELMLFSTNCYDYSYLFIECLNFFLENQAPTLVCLLLIRDCLQWSTYWDWSRKWEWIFQQCRRCLAQIDLDLDTGSASLLEKCLEEGANLCPTLDWNNLISQKVTSIDLGISVDSSSYWSPAKDSILSVTQSLMAGPTDVSRQPDLKEDGIFQFLNWFGDEMEARRWTPLKIRFEHLPNGPELIQNYTNLLSNCLIKEWIQYVESVIPSEQSSQNSDCLAGYVGFKIAVQSFTVLSSVVVNAAARDLSTLESDGTDSCAIGEEADKIVGILRDAVLELAKDRCRTMTLLEASLRPTRWTVLANESGHPSEHDRSAWASYQIRRELIETLTKACCGLRLSVLQRHHHQNVISLMFEGPEPLAQHGVSYNQDPMLYDMQSSTPSFRSFRRTGRMVRSKTRPSSVSSGVSRVTADSMSGLFGLPERAYEPTVRISHLPSHPKDPLNLPPVRPYLSRVFS